MGTIICESTREGSTIPGALLPYSRAEAGGLENMLPRQL